MKRIMKEVASSHSEHQRTIEVIVNSGPRQVHEREPSYAQGLELAFAGESNTETIIHTCGRSTRNGRCAGDVGLGANVSRR